MAARAGSCPGLGSGRCRSAGIRRPATRGAALSGGQRQRLALARALLADPALLVLDEPAAHLHSDARRALTRDILAATAGHATLLITHDRDGLDQLDEIVVLRDGRVIERGSHAELMRAKGGALPQWQCSSGQLSPSPRRAAPAED